MRNNLPIVFVNFFFEKFTKIKTNKCLIASFLLVQFFIASHVTAQQSQITDFVLFSGNGTGAGCSTPTAPGAGVQIGCNSTINGGDIGSLKLLQTTGSATISGNMHALETMDLASGSIVTGKLTAANAASISGTTLSIAGSSTIGGNIDVNGNVVVATGSSIFGKVTHPAGTSYSGPAPSGGNVIGTPVLPTLPSLPAISTFPSASSVDVTTTIILNPGNYRNMLLPGAKKITLNGPGVYVFNKVLNLSDNDLVYDFKNSTNGIFKIYIHGDADFNQIHASMINGGSANRIYTEVHGTGSTSSNGTLAFAIANCTGPIKSSWLGTVWAPYGAIKIGSLSGGTDITGALWSATQVNVRCGVTINGAPYNVNYCTTPNANAGSDKQLTCTSSTVQLNGSSSTSGVNYNWVASNGGNIVSGATSATPIVNAAGTYTLTVTTAIGGCTATDVAIVSNNTVVPNVNAGPDLVITCSNQSIQLTGSSTTPGVTYKWVPSNGGNTTSGSSTATPIANAPGTYTLTVTNPVNGCKASDVAIITATNTAPVANAGSNKTISCSIPSVMLSGSTSSLGVSYLWVASNGGNIVSGGNTLTPLVNAAGTYTLTVSSTNGCSASDIALVSGNTILPNANAGVDKSLTCTVSSVQLSGSSTTSGASFSWAASNGGNIVSGGNTATPTVNAAGTYTLTVSTNNGTCSSTDVALVSFTGTLPNANAGSDKILTCANPTAILNGSSTSSSINYSWVASNGGNIVSGANTATPTIDAAGTYTLTVTKIATGCTKTDVTLVTSNKVLPNVSAGADSSISCSKKTTSLQGSSSTAGVSYLWSSQNSSSILSSIAAAKINVDGTGAYYLTVTNPLNGCKKTDTAIVKGGCLLLYYPKDTVGKTDSLIGSELTSLEKYFKIYAPDTTQKIFRLTNDSVWIEVIALSGQKAALTALLQSAPYGMTNLVNNGTSLLITGKYPIKNLSKLNLLTSMIDYVRPLYPPLLSNHTQSEGDTSLRGFKARNGFSVKGSGVKVGVLSDSYNHKGGAANDVLNGDLPGTGNPDGDNAPVQVVLDAQFDGSDEGRAMMQIVHDVAPKASLAFRTGFIDANDFALGIKELKDVHNCQVIVDDITYITEPFFSDGVIANAVDYVASQGVAYFSSAGNFGGKSYQSVFNAATAPASISVGSAHNFGGGDVLQRVNFSAKDDYTIVLQWDDGIYSSGVSSGSQNDLDIYLTDDAGNILVGYNRNNLGRDPIEVLPISVKSNGASANLMIVRAAGSTPVKFKYIVFSGDMRIEEFKSDSSTIVGQANANGAITVGAAYYKETPAFRPGPAKIESFSSVGSIIASGGLRDKPDITAPDGGKTTVLFGGQNRFFGTSAAAPHAAGVAALMIQARSKFYSQTLPPAQLKSILKSTALDMAAPGFDKQSGAGLIQADNAILNFASAKPNITGLEIPASVTSPGTQAFTVTVNGEYLNAASKVLLNGQQLPTTFVNSTKLTAAIPTFSGNPPLQVSNPATVPNNNDGGISDPAFFYAKQKVVVKANDKVKKYGEAVGAFTHTITVNGVELSATGLTVADLGLNSILDSTSANSKSAALTQYYIRPYRAIAFNPANSADSVFLANYEYSWIEGSLTVIKMPLVIKARDTSMVYGSKIDGKQMKFDYTYDDSNIDPSEKANFFTGLKNLHSADITDAVAFADGRVANGKGIVISNADLSNLSMVATLKSVLNARTVINNQSNGTQTELVDIAPQSIFDYNEEVDSNLLISGYTGENGRVLIGGAALSNGKSIVISNGKSIVISNGTAKVISNGKSIVISNNLGVPPDTSNSNLAVIVDSLDVNNPSSHEIDSLLSINLITGTTVGNWSIVPAALLSDNFDISYQLGTLSITKASLTISADNKSRFYGSANPALTATYSGFVNGDTESSIILPTISTIATNTSPAGSYQIKVNGGSAINYSLNKVYGTLTVKKAPLTVTADDKSRQYGIANPVFTVSYSGFVNGENSSVLTTAPVATSSATQLSSVGIYAIKPAGGVANNYLFTYVNGSLTIGKATLTATADNKTKTYGSSNPSLTISYSGFLNGDDENDITQPTISTTAVKLSVVGNYPIVLNGGSDNNYTIINQDGNLSITPAILTVTADNKTISAGSPLPTFTYSTIGFVTNGANTISSGPQYSVSPVYSGTIGTYTITPSALVLNQPANYNIQYIAGTLNVTTSSATIKQIEVELECVDTLINDISGFAYSARFEYENDNCYSVSIPVGTDNNLTGNYSGSLSTTFYPGEKHFTIYFDGNPLTWTLKSYAGTIKKTSTATASKYSKTCHCSSSRLAQLQAELELTEENISKLKLYPNPASSNIHLTTEGLFESSTKITVYDLLGKIYPLKTSSLNASQQLELDVTSLKQGVYFIKVENHDESSVIRFVKQ